MTSHLDVVLNTDSLPTLTLETTLTRDPKSVHKWITETYQNIKANNSHQLTIVGMDTEWWRDGEVALLQLCFDKRVLVYQIIRSSYIPFSLIEFLNDENLMFTGVNTKQDFEKLARYGLARGGKDNREYFLSKIKDLQDGPGMKKKSLAKLMEELSGYKIDKDKSVSASNWENPLLSRKQVNYASIAAFASYMIGLKYKDPDNLDATDYNVETDAKPEAVPTDYEAKF